MLARLLIGIVKGLIVGALVGFGLAKIGMAAPGAVIAYLAAALTALFLGLVAGKPIGIGAAVWVARRTGLGRLPSDVTPAMVAGVAVLAGIGFTMSIFVAELGFSGRNLEVAKLAVLVASAFASVVGAMILRRSRTTCV